MPEEDGVVDLRLAEPRLLVPGGEDLHGHVLPVPHASPHLTVAPFACHGHGTVSCSPFGPPCPPHTRGINPAPGEEEQWSIIGPLAVTNSHPPTHPAALPLPRSRTGGGPGVSTLPPGPGVVVPSLAAGGRGSGTCPSTGGGDQGSLPSAQPLSSPTHSTRVICRATVRWTRKGSPEPLPVVQSSFSKSCAAGAAAGSLQRPPHSWRVPPPSGVVGILPGAHPPPKCCLPPWMPSA